MRWRTTYVLALVAGLAMSGMGLARPAAAAGTPAFSIDSVTIQEQDGGIGSLRFTVTLQNSPPGGASVQYQTSPVSATEKPSSSQCDTTHDYVQTFGSIALNATTTQGFVDVNICSDHADEPDETFNVTLFSPTNGATASGPGVGTILDNDPTPTLTVSNASVTEGNSGTNPRTIPVSLSNPSGSNVTFDYATQPSGTATPGTTSCTGTADYVTSSGSVTIPANATAPSTPLTIPICGDPVDEANQTFKLRISNVVHATGPSSDRTITILDDDATTSTISVNDRTANESTGTMTFTVAATPPPGAPITVSFSTAPIPGGATAGSSCTSGVDYISRTSSVTIPANAGGANVSITLCDDAIDENTETFALNLTSAPGSGGITDSQGIGSITDNDPTPTLKFTTGRTQFEGNTGHRNMAFIWTLTNAGSLQASGRPITFTFATADGTAVGGACGTTGVDYSTVNRTVTINPGSRVGSVSVPVCGDVVAEATETFTFSVSNLVNAVAGNLAGTGTIKNDDGPALRIVDRSVTEGNSGQKRVSITINFDAGAPAAGKVKFALSGAAVKGTRKTCALDVAGVDYLAPNPSSVSFAAGVRSVTISFDICGNTQFELDDPIDITIDSADWFSVGDGSGSLTIVNDDPFPG